LQINIAYLKNENQVNVITLDKIEETIKNITIDVSDIPDHDINLFIYDHNLNLEHISGTLEKEKSLYYITGNKDMDLNWSHLESITFQDLYELYNKLNNRWILANNINAIENMYPMITHMRSLWIKERNAFFEELWYFIKKNLATTSLNIIFNDLVNPDEKNKTKENEKEKKPELTQSFIKGTKKANFFPGEAKENHLMDQYAKDFSAIFEVTEYDQTRGQFVATCKINLSPILIMANISSLNQIQRALLSSLFTGLQH
jgi:hypothetical protein